MVEVRLINQGMVLGLWSQSDDLIGCLVFAVNCIGGSIPMLHFPKWIFYLSETKCNGIRTSKREEVERLEVGVAAPLLELF